MAAYPVRNRLIPFKLLALLLYAQESEWMQIARDQSPSDRILQLGPTARLLRVSSARLRDHLNWLSNAGYIAQLELSHGSATLKLRNPNV